MRQTSQAVALLLATVNAADVTVGTVQNTASATTVAYQGTATVFSTKRAIAPVAFDQIQSRTAPYYNYLLESQLMTWSNASNEYKTGYVLKNADLNTAVSKKAGSSCMQCISYGGVWCSRTFNFWLTGTSDYQYTILTAGSQMNEKVPSKDAEMTVGTYDNGSCCQSSVEFVKMTGYVGKLAAFPAAYAAGADGSGSAATNGVTFVNASCVAAASASNNDKTTNGGETKFGQSSFYVTATAWMSWWCNNGLYAKITGTSAGNGSANTTQTFQMSSNQRRELAQVGCPNRASLCGGGSDGSKLTTGIVDLDTETNQTKTITVGAVDLKLTDKCTWTAYAYKYAPTFLVDVDTAGNKWGITSSAWQLHTMEYVVTTGTYAAGEGALSVKTGASASGFVAETEGANPGNYAPRFDMEAQQFNTLRTWYGATSTVQTAPAGAQPYGSQYSSWFTPGHNGFKNNATTNATIKATNGQQQYGNVATIGTSTNQAEIATLTSTTGNYGTVNAEKFDFRSVRYVPAAQIQSVYKTGSDLATAYNAKISDYNTAKTVWNNYVAILSKNAKMDAFAAAFSPPKAPTVPPLPNFPWAPAAYSGYLKQTTKQDADFKFNTGKWSASAQPASNQFWTSLDSAQSLGGWGAWTAQIMTFRAGWGKSFGTIGFGSDQTMSYVWQNNWMCSDKSPTPQTDLTACAPNVASAGTGDSADTPNKTMAKVTTFNAAGAGVMFVSTVSLWSLGNKSSDGTTLTNADWKTKSDLSLTFTGKAWSNTLPALTAAVSYNTAPGAANSLTGIAGAQALAASSAAVLALAALY